MSSKPLCQGTFIYHFEGREHSFRVDELNDGMWSIYCFHDLFREVNGDNFISNVTNVTEGLEKMAEVHKASAQAMLESFSKYCTEKVQAYCHWMRDRRTFYHLN